MTAVNVRNLEQIQEAEAGRAGPRLGALLLGSLTLGALVVAGLTMRSRGDEPTRSSVDPLAELVEKTKGEQVPPHRLDTNEVTFPSLLRDSEHSTTAAAALKDERGRLVKQAPSQEVEQGLTPPPAGDRLSVMPLSARSLLNATSVTNAPKDDLTALAVESADRALDDKEMAPAGSDQGFQLQVASFKEQADADALVEKLRRRGHTAFRQAAEVPGRGLWHRVRVGPFKNKYQANLYKAKFETNERLAPFVVDPQKVRHAEKIRSAKLAARMKKYGSR